jgi:hypothetical protein
MPLAVLLPVMIGVGGCGAVSKFGEHILDGIGFLAVVKECRQFSFGGTGEDFLKDLTVGQDGTTGWWVRAGGSRGACRQRRMARKIMNARSAGASFCFGKVGGITFDMSLAT